MKTLLLAVSAMMLVLVSSCKKDNNILGTTNGWVVNDSTYNVAGISNRYQYGNNYYALRATSSSPEGMMDIVFPERPVSSGKYRIGSSINASQIVVNLQLKNRTYGFESTGTDDVYAIVAVVNKKLRIQLPKFQVINKAFEDSLQVAATLTER